jgi:hypothetical protein
VPKDFLGRGWKFSVGVDETGKIALSEFEQDIRESIRLILLTARGERVMRPDFGAGLHEFVFSTMSATNLGSMQTAVREALIKWEPRIQLLEVKVAPDAGEIGKLLINIDYRVRVTNNRFNLVFPFFLKEQA